MKAGYSVQHVFRGNYLGNEYRFAELVNDHVLNKVFIVYLKIGVMPTHETTAIFRLKPNPLTTNEKIAK